MRSEASPPLADVAGVVRQRVSVSIEIGTILEAMVACDLMTRFANGRAAFELGKEST